MPPIVSGGSYEFALASVGGTWSWAVRANNVQGAGQLYEVINVRTPYGPIERVASPIPGDVILEMAMSVQSVQGQLSPMLALVSPGTTSFTITIVEGDANQVAATVPFQNAGNFGSFMTVNGTPGAPWLQVNPTSVAGIAKGEQGAMTVTLLTSSLLNSGSPYSGSVSLQDNRSVPTVIVLTFNVVVLPRPSIGVSPPALGLSYFLSTQSSGPSAILTVSNSGPVTSSLNWSVAKLLNSSPWLSFTPSTGGPLASGGSSNVTCTLVPSLVPQVVGTFQETLRVTSPNASNSPVDVPLVLTVNP